MRPAARGPAHRREIAAAEAVDQVVDRGEAGLLDDGSGGGEVTGRAPGTSCCVMASNAAAATACSSAYSAVGGAPTVKVRSSCRRIPARPRR